MLTINWYGWVLHGSFGREGGKGEEATYERGWESEQITDLIGTGGHSMEVLVKSSVPGKPSNLPFSKQETLSYIPGARFSKVSIVFRVRKLSAFMFTVFAFKIKLSIILKVIQ